MRSVSALESMKNYLRSNFTLKSSIIGINAHKKSPFNILEVEIFYGYKLLEDNLISLFLGSLFRVLQYG